jgi:hypothetical protein
MHEPIAHESMRAELLLWLNDAMSSDAKLNGLVAFLKDDFPYDAEYVVGLVLRSGELQPWQELMVVVEPMRLPLSQNEIAPVRERAHALLAATSS